MPLIKCPDCDKEISPSAPTCPHCGRPQAPAAAANIAPTTATPKKASNLLIALMILEVSIWAFSVVRNYIPPSLAQSTSSQPNPANLKYRDMIRQQQMQCEIVLGVKTAENGEDAVT